MREHGYIVGELRRELRVRLESSSDGMKAAPTRIERTERLSGAHLQNLLFFSVASHSISKHALSPKMVGNIRSIERATEGALPQLDIGSSPIVHVLDEPLQTHLGLRQPLGTAPQSPASPAPSAPPCADQLGGRTSPSALGRTPWPSVHYTRRCQSPSGWSPVCWPELGGGCFSRTRGGRAAG